MLVFFLGLTFAKNACVSGSAECVANTLRVCGIKNQWIYVDCPAGTECAVKGNEIACVPRSNKGKTGSRDETRPGRKDEPSTPQDPGEEQGSEDNAAESDKDDRKEDDDRNDDDRNDGDRHDEKRRKRSRPEKESSVMAEKIKPKVGKSGIDRSKQHGSKEKDEEKDAGKGRRKEVKTVTKTISTSKRESGTTVTVTRTIVQRQPPTEIKLEYTSSDIEPKVKPIGSSSSGQVQASQSPGKGASGSNQSVSPSAPGGMGESSPSGKASSGPGSPSSGAAPSSNASPGSGSSSPSSSLTTNKPATMPSSSSSPSGSPSQGKSQGSGVGSGKSEQKPQRTSSPPSGGSNPSVQQGGGTNEKAGGAGTGGSSSPPATQPGKDSGTSEGNKPSGGTSGGAKKGSSGGGVNISSDQLTQAMTKLGFSPKPEYIEAIVSRVNEKFSDLNEATMFIAQCAHESGGYQYIEEVACAGGTGCAGQYGTGAPGKSYHGRGFIQLSWPDNYKAAGEALGLGEELYNNPEKVSEDPNLGADVSIFYWESRVANAPGVKENHFGATTKAINGALECTGSNTDKSKKRYEIYMALVEAFGVNNPADESGCYS
ncbi:ENDOCHITINASE [Encephalitozoon cuniculi GB-M1]|uniref:ENDOCHITINASE n=1 Tax=Encephalitozoon cuniculi (strain GB-M1) TaxID=284813 RepID=Q8STP5_ENCCU|nr:endochitinase [Encephalitozoon cuniculi GB-M1]CAD27103.1 ENDOCHITINASE [Encephalitozoon cuniculi GB-M1]